MTTGAETLYTFRTAYPDVVQVDRAVRVSCPVWRDNAVVTPSATTFELQAPNGSTVVAATAATIGPDGVPYYDLTSTHTASSSHSLGEGYVQIWTHTIDGRQVGPIDRETVYALRPLYPVVADSDLEGMYPALPQHRGNSIATLQPWLDEAWRQIVGRLCSEGHITYSIRSAWALRTVHAELALALFYDSLAAGKPAADGWRVEAQLHRDRYETGWSRMSWRLDSDQDGHIDDLERRHGAGSGIVHINQSPKGYRYRLRARDARW